MSTTTTLPRLHLVWVHGEQLWVAHTEDEHIYVEHSLYARYRREHFVSLGIESKTWTEYLSAAEDAWRRQCEMEKQLRASGVAARDMKKRFLSLGLTWQAWTHYMQPAEDAWRRQCEAEAALQTCLDFWKEVPGVRIVRKGERSLAFL
jgi:hypothetical protein